MSEGREKKMCTTCKGRGCIEWRDAVSGSFHKSACDAPHCFAAQRWSDNQFKPEPSYRETGVKCPKCKDIGTLIQPTDTVFCDCYKGRQAYEAKLLRDFEVRSLAKSKQPAPKQPKCDDCEDTGHIFVWDGIKHQKQPCACQGLAQKAEAFFDKYKGTVGPQQPEEDYVPVTPPRKEAEMRFPVRFLLGMCIGLIVWSHETLTNIHWKPTVKESEMAIQLTAASVGVIVYCIGDLIKRGLAGEFKEK